MTPREMIAEVRASSREVAELATLLSLATRIEPALIRSMRLSLVGTADVTDEAALWSSPLVEARAPSYMVLSDEVIRELREELRASEKLEAARRVVEQGHAELPPLLQLEEKVTYLALSGASEQEIEDELARAFVAMTREKREGIADWVDRALVVAPDEVRRSEVGQRLAARANLVRSAGAASGNGGAREEWGWLGRDLPRRDLGVRLSREGALEIGGRDLSEATLVQAPDGEPAWVQVRWREAGRERYASREVFEDTVAQVPAVGGQFTLRFADGRQYRFEERSAETQRWLDRLAAADLKLERLARDLERTGDLPPGPHLPGSVRAAVRAFQERMGLVVDAVVGSETLAALARELGEGEEPTRQPRVSLASPLEVGGEFHGREAELKWLDDAWSQGSNLVEVVGWGGSGKSALVAEWLRRLAVDGHRGAAGVFTWSFFSQGTGDRMVSSNEFIDRALRYFGDADAGAGSPWEKGTRLAQMVARERNLLILDGVEPLQDPGGELRDAAMSTLLNELAAENSGLCVVTSRLGLPRFRPGSDVRRLELERLSKRDGAQLLRRLGVRGSMSELEQASSELEGHPLALSLLGRYLAQAHDGDVKRRDRVLAMRGDEAFGGAAGRVMESYERWLSGRPALTILRLLGLFDRPADAPAIAALRSEPAIENLTDERVALGEPEPEPEPSVPEPSVPEDLTVEFVALREADWRAALEELRRLRLIAESGPEVLDCHPLIREYFGSKLRAGYPEAWRQGHERLFRHYTEVTEERPETLEGLRPLFHAVQHGCFAQRYQEALHEVLIGRIERGDASYASGVLGASLLSPLAAFFESPWNEVVEELKPDERAYVLNATALQLRYAGRLAEAVEPMRSALEIRLENGDWRNASYAGLSLSSTLRIGGDMKASIAAANEAVELADRSEDVEKRIRARGALATSLHWAGRDQEAESFFQEAEALLREYRPEAVILVSEEGFEYCEMLLAQGRFEAADERSRRLLEWAESTRVLVDVGLAHLVRGQFSLALEDTPAASVHLRRAIDGLRAAGRQEYLARGLLARADFHLVRHEWDRARADLDEVLSLVRDGGFRLLEADVFLRQCRLELLVGNVSEARRALEQASASIEESGYNLRAREIEELKHRIEQSRT